MRFAACVVTFAILVGPVGCVKQREQAPLVSEKPRPERTDTENGLTLRLALDKGEYKPGDWVTATATLENTTSSALAVHFLSIKPMHVLEEDCKCFTVQSFMEAWRFPYHGTILDGNPGFTMHCFDASFVLGPEADAKLGHWAVLNGAGFGYYWPQYTIPPFNAITCKTVFEAKKGLQFIDVGLFSLESFYPKKILALSGTAPFGEFVFGQTRPAGVKFFPKIWFGSLYVKIDLRVE